MSSRCVRLLSASWPGSRCRSAQRTQHLSRRQGRIQDHFDALLLPTYLILFQAGYGLPSTHPLSEREKRITHRPLSHPHKLFPSSSTRSKRSSPLDGAFSLRLTSVFARTVLEQLWKMAARVPFPSRESSAQLIVGRAPRQRQPWARPSGLVVASQLPLRKDAS
jgi:hypothetical protein